MRFTVWPASCGQWWIVFLVICHISWADHEGHSVGGLVGRSESGSICSTLWILHMEPWYVPGFLLSLRWSNQARTVTFWASKTCLLKKSCWYKMDAGHLSSTWWILETRAAVPIHFLLRTTKSVFLNVDTTTSTVSWHSPEHWYRTRTTEPSATLSGAESNPMKLSDGLSPVWFKEVEMAPQWPWVRAKISE